jgi:hypothetical protein
MIRFARLTILCVALAAGVACKGNPRDADSVVEFCHFEVDEVHRTGYGDYQVIASFRVIQGKPADIRVTYDRLAVEQQTRDCISRWRLGFVDDDAEVDAVFQWRHAIGWTTLDLSWPGHLLRIPLSGQLHPYQSTRSVTADLPEPRRKTKGDDR